MSCLPDSTRRSNPTRSWRGQRHGSAMSSSASSRFFAEALREDHDLSTFSCGNEELDAWLRDRARNATRAGTARTRVWLDEQGVVVAYFASAPHLASRETLPKKVTRGAPPVIPGYLLAKLALASDLQRAGRGNGSLLLVDALRWLLGAARQAGGKVVLVDAIDD